MRTMIYFSLQKTQPSSSLLAPHKVHHTNRQEKVRHLSKVSPSHFLHVSNVRQAFLLPLKKKKNLQSFFRQWRRCYRQWQVLNCMPPSTTGYSHALWQTISTVCKCCSCTHHSYKNLHLYRHFHLPKQILNPTHDDPTN